MAKNECGLIFYYFELKKFCDEVKTGFLDGYKYAVL